MPTGSLPLPPRGGRALRPILVVRFILRYLEAMQCRQRFLDVRSMSYWHRVGTHKVRTDPPIATIFVDFFFGSVVCVIFVRQFVHLAGHFFSATQFHHGLSEPCSTNKPIVNVLVLFLSILFLELICRVVFSTTFFPYL